MRFACSKLLLLACVASLGIWLGFPNDFFSLPFLALLWPLALALTGKYAASWEGAASYGWLGSFCGITAALYWLALPIAQVGDLPWPVAFLCTLLIAFCLSLQGAIFASFAWHIRGYGPLIFALASGLAWYLLEYVFAICPGFPWLALAGSLAPWPLLTQAAAVTGAFLLGGIWLTAALFVLLAFLPGAYSIAARMSCASAGCAIALVLLSYGAGRIAEIRLTSGTPQNNFIQAALIEGNIDQNQKWTLPFQRESLNIYIGLTNEALAQRDDHPLIIWPETALPFFVEKRPEFMGEVREEVRKWGSPLLFGAPGAGASNNGIYNRAFLMAPDGQLAGTYDKEQLVPFGETVPPWLKLKFLEPLLQGTGVYTQGSDPKPLLWDKLAMGVLICYEGIFPWLAQSRVAAGSNLLIDISNDGWFGRTPAARQHLYLTALRCIEQGRWLLRATNTGISASIDPAGSIVKSGPMFQMGYLPCEAILLSDMTIFHRIYDFLPWLCLALLAGLLGAGHLCGCKVSEKRG